MVAFAAFQINQKNGKLVVRRLIKSLAGLSLAVAITQPLSACAAPNNENEALRNTHEKIVRNFEGVSHISAASLSDMAPKEYVLFDVRESEEYDVSHINGAIWVDPDIDAEEFLELYGDRLKGKFVILYCSVGVRSSRIAEQIKAYQSSPTSTSIYNLEAGVFGWHNEKRPLVQLSEDGPISTEFIHPYNRWWGRMLNRDALKKYNSD